MPLTKIIDYRIPDCPKCHGSHDYKLKVFVKDEKPVMLFGGPGEQAEVMFDCPETGQLFSHMVPVPEGGEIAGVATPDEFMAVGASAPLNPVKEEGGNEFNEWIRTSRSTALDYCKNMLSSSVGAIPVYFVVIKYLGGDHAGQGFNVILLLPPVLFLLAALSFVMGLKPGLGIIKPANFQAFREKRLRQLNKSLVTGTSLFVAGIILSILIFFSAF